MLIGDVFSVPRYLKQHCSTNICVFALMLPNTSTTNLENWINRSRKEGHFIIHVLLYFLTLLLAEEVLGPGYTDAFSFYNAKISFHFCLPSTRKQ